MEHQEKILIVDDVVENIQILSTVLRDEYAIYFAKNGEAALQLARTKLPDLILLDIIMPEMDGYEVCCKLQDDPKTSNIPVIFVSAKGEVLDETRGFEVGAVDYIIKPISAPVVQARVKTHLRLRQMVAELERLNSLALDANPMTGLPGNKVVTDRIKQALADRKDVCVIYTDLDNFKAYNDKYGFAMGDDIILFTSHSMKEALSACGVKDGFLGHIGGDDFVVIVDSGSADLVAEKIITIFDKNICRYYRPEDVASGGIDSQNRQGERQTFPLMTISLAGVDLALNSFSQYLQVNDACAEAKKVAKDITGSVFFRDRRKS